MEQEENLLGKKIFFLHPSTFIQNEIAAELAQQEYEVYLCRDHEGLKKVLKRNPDSIVFAYIDDRMSEKDWETWIRGIINSPDTSGVGVGVLSSSTDEVLQRKYINSIKIPCGFIYLKADLNKTMKHITDILNARQAKGRRKYIRATSDNENLTTLNMSIDGEYVSGKIRDISSVGLSCKFPENITLAKNAYYPDIQLKLQSTLIRVDGIVFGSRMEGMDKVYVILFSQKIDPEAKTKIRKYIQLNLQAKMDMELR